MAGEKITERKAKFTLPLEKAAKIMGIKLEYDPYEDFYSNISAKDVLSGSWRMPKKFDGAEELFPNQVAYALNDSEQDGMAAAAHKRALSALEDSFSEISGVVCEYLGENSDGEQVSVSTKGGIESVSIDGDTVHLEVSNPEHLINAMIDGVGMFNAEIPVDGEIDQKEFESYAHVLADYYDVFGERKPSVDLDHIDAGNNDEFFAEQLEFHLGEIGVGEIAELIEDYVDRTSEDPVATMTKMSKLLGGRISVEEMKKAWNDYNKSAADKKMGRRVESKSSMKKALVEREGKGFIESYPELASKLKDALEDVQGDVEKEYETYGGDVEEVEHKSRDGFISSNDGGYKFSQFAALHALDGAGRSLSGRAQEAVDRLVKYNQEAALENFIEKNKDQLKDVPQDKINYHDLYEIGLEKLAEELSEMETEAMAEDTIMFEALAYMHDESDRDGGISFTVQSAINWETPYHRRGKSNEIFKEIDVSFEDAEDMTKNFDRVLAAVKECGAALVSGGDQMESKQVSGKSLTEAKKDFKDFKEPFENEAFAKKLNEKAGKQVAVPADEEGMFVLTDEYAQDLAKTWDIFTSGKYAEERIEDSKDRTERTIMKSIKDVATELKVRPRSAKAEAVFVDDHGYVGFNVNVKVNGQEKKFSNVGYSDDGGVISDACESWDWAYALMDDDSPFQDSMFTSSYTDDNNSQAVEQFSHDYDQSALKQDVEDWLMKVLPVSKQESSENKGKTLYEMARQVTDQVAAAFLAGEKKKVGNTETDGTSFYLHGNEIATKKHGDLYVTNAGWPTATTRERINGIIQAAGIDAKVAQKGGKQILVIGGDTAEWDGKWKSVGSIGGQKSDDKEFAPAANESKQPKQFKSRIDEEVEIAKSIDPRLFKMYEGA